MTFSSILLIAVSLAVDATAVAAARAVTVPRILPRHILVVAVFFGGFQALMPLVGWAVGSWIGPLVATFAPWIAFVLLVAIGARMLWEGRGEARAKDLGNHDPFGLRIMLLLAIATSVDALAVGITLPMIKAPLISSILTIGTTAATLSAAGLIVGRRFRIVAGGRLNLIGGVVLIGLGVKVLVEHFLVG